MANPFDARAKTWDEQPRRLQLAADIFAAIEKQVPLHCDWAALDYGAGTGLLTHALAPRVRRVTAVDSSAGMLAVLAKKAQATGMANIEPLLADFAKDPLPTGPYDLIASAMTLHHVADVAALLCKFLTLLAPGGHLALADLDAEDGSFHDTSNGIHHFGFDREVFSNQLAAAGFVEIRFTTAARIARHSRTYPVFLATARKP